MEKPKNPGPKVNEDEATLQLIQMALLFRRGKKTMSPVTIEATKRFKELLGIESLATGEKSDEFPKGKCYWQFPDDLALNLERIGIDPATHICIDRGKFNLALLELEHAKAAKLEAKYAGQDLEARKAAIKEAMQTYRPTKPPKTASPQHYLQNHVLNSKIASHLRKAQAEEEMDSYVPAPAKQTTTRKKICGPQGWEPNGLTL